LVVLVEVHLEAAALAGVASVVVLAAYPVAEGPVAAGRMAAKQIYDKFFQFKL
jgi:hypothetical protein